MTFEELRNILQECDKNVRDVYRKIRELHQSVYTPDIYNTQLMTADNIVWAAHNLLCATIEILQDDGKVDTIYLGEKLRKAIRVLGVKTVYAVVQDGKSLYSSSRYYDAEECFEDIQREILENWLTQNLNELSDKEIKEAWEEYCANANEEDIPYLVAVVVPHQTLKQLKIYTPNTSIKEKAMLYRYLITSGDEEGEEFQFDDLVLCISNGILWILCPRSHRDIEARDLYELSDTEEGEEVVIEFDEYFLEECRYMRALHSLDH